MPHKKRKDNEHSRKTTTKPPLHFTNALSALSMEVAKTSIDPALKHLIDIRVSQLNGCTFCLDMHSKEAKLARARAAPVTIWRPARVPRCSAPVNRGAGLHRSADPNRRSRRERCAVPQRGGALLGRGDLELNFAIVAINARNRWALPPHGAGLDAAYGLNKANLNNPALADHRHQRPQPRAGRGDGW